MHPARLVGLVAVLVLTLPRSSRAQDGPALADAALRCVWMVDAREGWAVGDDGVILHTTDGWESCDRQTTHVRASLRGVHFVDPYIGYAVGLEVLPFGRGTAGVVLGTTDGGATWNKLVNRDLPGLSAVCFADADVGFAFGDTTGGNASGVFMTVNRGKSWTTAPALTATSGWGCGSLYQGTPLFAGTGQVGTIEKDQVFVLPTKLPPQVAMLSMAAKDHDIWAVGTRATVLVSRKTGGKSWEPVKLPMPDHLMASLDFNSVCCQGDHVWIAGRPGSVVFHSWDRGQSWEAQRTGQAFPLQSMCFADEKTGWAVGECGTILQTKDGGRSWAVRRRGGHRSAVMFVTAQAPRHQANLAHQLPLGTMAVVGGDQGYLTTALQVMHRPDEYRMDCDRLRQAVRTVGGSSAEVLTPFVVADYQETMPKERLAQLLETNRLVEQFVLALRIWRPSVVVVDEPEAFDPITRLVREALDQACESSGNASNYPDHFTKFDLQPWRPARLFVKGRVRTKVGLQDPDTVVDLDLPRPVLFAAANDFANLARPLILDRFPAALSREEYTLRRSWGESANVTTDLMAGLTLGHGGQARREKVDVEDFKYQLLLAATKQQWDNTQTARMKVSDPAEETHFFTNLEKSLVGLAPMTIGDRIYAKATEFADQGQWTMARECHLMLLDLMPTHRLAPESCRFLLTTMGSSEARRRVELGQVKTMAQYSIRSGFTLTDREGKINLDQKDHNSVVQRRRTELRRWNEGAVAAGEIYSALEPLGFPDPALQFCLQAARRAEGGEGNRLWPIEHQLRQPPGSWYDVAATELWLSQPIGAAPRPVLHARRVATPSKRVGRLDEAVWKEIPATRFRVAAGQAATTEVRMAYDDQYLYLAVNCQSATAAQAPVKNRQRDEDLSSYDRISLMLDLDRDYTSYFHFEFDQRGCLTEDCSGDKTWNPKWFVEVQPTKNGWSAEVAIPLVELTGKASLTGEVWACNVSRITPGVGIQAASLPAGVKPRCEGMGLLKFEDADVKQAGK